MVVDLSVKLLTLHCRYGEIESIRVLHERFCAFVNFKNANMAARAMEKLNVSTCWFPSLSKLFKITVFWTHGCKYASPPYRVIALRTHV